MDYVLDKLPDGRTRVVFHIRYGGNPAMGCVPYLGYTIDTIESWLRITAWYDIRDAQQGTDCERRDTVFYSAAPKDSVRLVTASIYRDSLEYPFAKNDWNPADSFYFFNQQGRNTAPYAFPIRLQPDRSAARFLIRNPARLPLRSIEVLTLDGRQVQQESGKAIAFSTAKLQPGFYFVRFRSDYGSQVEIAIITP
jgi:hypothetical protein